MGFLWTILYVRVIKTFGQEKDRARKAPDARGHPRSERGKEVFGAA